MECLFQLLLQSQEILQIPAPIGMQILYLFSVGGHQVFLGAGQSKFENCQAAGPLANRPGGNVRLHGVGYKHHGPTERAQIATDVHDHHAVTQQWQPSN